MPPCSGRQDWFKINQKHGRVARVCGKTKLKRVRVCGALGTLSTRPGTMQEKLSMLHLIASLAPEPSTG